MFNRLYILKKYLNVLFSLIVVAFAITGGYGILKLMGYLDSMGNGSGELIIINKYLFSEPIFLLFVPVVIRIWRKSIQDNINFPKNALAANIAIYISIFIIGGMVTRTVFAQKADSYGYTHCLSKEDESEIEATGRTIPVRPKDTVWMPKGEC